MLSLSLSLSRRPFNCTYGLWLRMCINFIPLLTWSIVNALHLLNCVADWLAFCCWNGCWNGYYCGNLPWGSRFSYINMFTVEKNTFLRWLPRNMLNKEGNYCRCCVVIVLIWNLRINSRAHHRASFVFISNMFLLCSFLVSHHNNHFWGVVFAMNSLSHRQKMH